jgi:hypothetical protein
VLKINAYLTSRNEIIIKERKYPLSDFPKMCFGNMPNDGGGLILNSSDRNELFNQNPDAKIYIKKLVGSAEFIRRKNRYCLWIHDEQRKYAEIIPFIKKRIELTRKHRLSSPDKGANKLAIRSYQFRDTIEPNNNQLIIPSLSSGRYVYIPSGYLGKDTVISNLAQVIYDSEPWIMSIIISKIHMVWVRGVSGRFQEEPRYTSQLSYNTFPFPFINDKQKQELSQCALRIIDEREKYPEKSLSYLYDPDKMPDGLREAHNANDLAVESCYRLKPFTGDDERLEYLLKLYEQMIESEKNRGTLFGFEETPKRKRSRK